MIHFANFQLFGDSKAIVHSLFILYSQWNTFIVVLSLMVLLLSDAGIVQRCWIYQK